MWMRTSYVAEAKSHFYEVWECYAVTVTSRIYTHITAVDIAPYCMYVCAYNRTGGGGSIQKLQHIVYQFTVVIVSNSFLIAHLFVLSVYGQRVM